MNVNPMDSTTPIEIIPDPKNSPTEGQTEEAPSRHLWGRAVILLWTIAVAAGTVLTWHMPSPNLTMVLLSLALLGSFASEQWAQPLANNRGFSLDGSFLIYCLEMAILGPTFPALSALVDNAAHLKYPPMVRWGNALMFSTMGLVGGEAFRLFQPKGVNVCSSIGRPCGDYLGFTFLIAFGILTLNFALVWLFQYFLPGKRKLSPWSDFGGILASTALALPVVGIILVAWAKMGSLVLLVAMVMAGGFMWLLHRMYAAEALTGALNQMAGHLESERLYRVLADNLPDISVAFITPDLEIAALHGSLVTPSMAQKSMGAHLDSLSFLSPTLRSLAIHHCSRALDGEKASFETERGDYIFDVTVSPVQDEATTVSGVLAVIQNVTERRLGERKLAHQANHDTLTGLANRGAFMGALARESTGSRTVMMLDLDKFKDINDSLGHENGDVLLTEIASRLMRTIRPTDLAARLAGDEFAVLLEDGTTENEAHAVGELIVSVLSEPVQLCDTIVEPSISLGISSAHGPTQPRALLHQADVAMYAAKSRGGRQQCLYRPSLGHTPRANRRKH